MIMEDTIIKLLNDNGIQASNKYPQGNTPDNYVVVIYTGSSKRNNFVLNYQFDLHIYSKTDLISFESNVFDLILNEIVKLKGIGNPQLNAKPVDTNKIKTNNLKKSEYTYSVDKLRL